MSGGIAYVYDPDGDFEDRANTGMVTLMGGLESKDRDMITRLVENHAAYTDSDRAAELLDDWDAEVEHFTKVMPDAYAEVIADRERDDVRNEPPAKAAASAEAAEADFAASTDD
jgi:glutamate synthase (NADPH/NADH) large chain